MLGDMRKTLVLILVVLAGASQGVSAFGECSCKLKKPDFREELDAREWFSRMSLTREKEAEDLSFHFLRVVLGYIRQGLFQTSLSKAPTIEAFFTPEILGGYCILAQGIGSIYLDELGVSKQDQLLLEMGKDFGSSQVHALIIVKMPDDNFYLIDPTFAQFLHPNHPIGKIGKKILDSGAKQLVKNLCELGFSRIDDNLLQKYINAFPVDDHKLTKLSLVKMMNQVKNENPLNRLLYGEDLPHLAPLQTLRFNFLHEY